MSANAEFNAAVILTGDLSIRIKLVGFRSVTTADVLRQSWQEFLPSGQSSLLLMHEGSGSRELEKEIRDALGASAYVSLSHTRVAGCEWIIGVGLAPKSANLLGIGVDMEDIHRKVNPKLKGKMEAGNQIETALNPLELWVIKEACFKSDPHNEGRVLSHYSVSEWDPKLLTGQAVGLEGLRICFKQVRLEDRLIAFAYSVKR